MNSKEEAPDDKENTIEPEDDVPNDLAEAEGKKHIKFTSSIAKVGKDKTSRAGKKPKTPKHDREIQAFRRETLEEIRKFRAARKEWLNSVENTEVKTNAVENTLQAAPIDKRRISIMKKLGVKTSMIRPHRKTLRPRIYFTFKKSLTQQDRAKAEALVKVRATKQNEKIKSTLKKDFSKLTKKASARIMKESKASLQAAKRKSAKVYSKSSTEATTPTKEAIEIAQLTGRDWSGEKSARRRKAKEKPTYGFPSKGMKIREGGGAIKIDSREEFDSIIKQLQSHPKYSTKALTDEDVKDLKNVWRQFHPQLVVEKGTPEAKEAKKVPVEKKTHAKRKARDGLNWLKKKLWIHIKPDTKPCSCKFVQGDGVVLLKKGCGCCAKLPAEKTITVESKSPEEIALEHPPITEEPIPAKSSFSTSSIVGSLEIMKKKLPFKSQSPADEESLNVKDFNRVGTVDESLQEDFRPDSLIGSSRSFMPTTSRATSRKYKDDFRDPKPILGKKSKKLVRTNSHINFTENQVASNDQEKKMSKNVMSVANVFKKYP